MSDSRKRVHLLCVENEKLGRREKNNYMPIKGRQNLAETDRDHIIKRNGQKQQQQLPKGFAESCYKTVSLTLVQKLINNFGVCKHCSGTLLIVEDVSHGFENQSYIFRKGTTLFNRSTQNMPHFYVMLHKVYIFKLIWKPSQFIQSMFGKLDFCETEIDFI